MTGWDIFLIAWFAFSACMTVMAIGLPRKPITPGVALASLALTALLAYAAVWA